MRDGEWRLIHPDADLTFGTAATPVFNRTAPDLGDYAVRAADSDRARGDGVAFGTDFFGARTITFDLGVSAGTEAAVRTAMGDLARAWRADTVRSTPGAAAELRSCYRGSERVVFGRPRRFAPNLAQAKTGRLAAADATFGCADERWYSPVLREAGVSIVPAPGGGLTAPLVAPLTTTASSDRSSAFTVTSDLPVWPVVEVTGPVTNPGVEVVGQWRLEVGLSLAYDQRLVIDTQPWARTVLRDGASVAGALTRASARLADTALRPGAYELVLRGTSSTGSAAARLRWRDAYTTP